MEEPVFVAQAPPEEQQQQYQQPPQEEVHAPPVYEAPVYETPKLAPLPNSGDVPGFVKTVDSFSRCFTLGYWRIEKYLQFCCSIKFFLDRRLITVCRKMFIGGLSWETTQGKIVLFVHRMLSCLFILVFLHFTQSS